LTGPSDTNSRETVLRIPDLGGVQDVAVLEVLVKPGDRVEVDTPLATRPA
jgi:pyruvate dehydrogenase E2 component (dihydrolipoamide acetyltransferase)